MKFIGNLLNICLKKNNQESSLREKKIMKCFKKIVVLIGPPSNIVKRGATKQIVKRIKKIIECTCLRIFRRTFVKKRTVCM